MLTVGEIYALIDQMAPFDTQEEWDNSGLLAGSASWPVEKILCALDLTPGVIDEALEMGCQLVVTHHPILFHVRKNLREDDPEGRLLGRLIRSGLAHIAAHTNFDRAPGGVNDCLAGALALQDVREIDEGLRIGVFSGDLRALDARARAALGSVNRVYGNGRGREMRVAVCGGAGGSLWRIARAAGADAYVTGEIKYSDILDCVADGLSVIEAGHDKTERISVKALRKGLQSRLDAVQCSVLAYESKQEPF